MKKILFILLATSLVFTSCKKEELTPAENPNPPVVVNNNVTQYFALENFGNFDTKTLKIFDGTTQVLNQTIYAFGAVSGGGTHTSTTLTKDIVYTAELHETSLLFSAEFKIDSNGGLVIVTPDVVGSIVMEVYSGTANFSGIVFKQP